MAIELHDYVLSADCYTVRLMLSLLGITPRLVATDVYPGGQPAPVLIDGEVVLEDPGIILAYLARGHGPHWLAAEAGGEVAAWLAFAATQLRPLAEARQVAAFGRDGDLEALNAGGRAALRQLEDALTLGAIDGGDWLAGGQPSIADIAVFPHAMLSHDSGIGHEDYPAINLWQRRLRRLPGFVGMPGIPDYF